MKWYWQYAKLPVAPVAVEAGRRNKVCMDKGVFTTTMFGEKKYYHCPNCRKGWVKPIDAEQCCKRA